MEPTQCDGDIDVGISLSYSAYANEFAVSVTNRLNYSYVDGELKGGEMGEEPVDGLGVQWGEDDWKIPDRNKGGNAFDGDTHTEWDDGSWNKQGGAFRVQDKQMCIDAGVTGGLQKYEWTPYEFSSVYLVPGPNHESTDGITASYVHTWTGTNLSFGVSYPYGITVSGSNSVDSEDFQTKLNGTDSLRVTEEDAFDV